MWFSVHVCQPWPFYQCFEAQNSVRQLLLNQAVFVMVRMRFPKETTVRSVLVSAGRNLLILNLLIFLVYFRDILRILRDVQTPNVQTPNIQTSEKEGPKFSETRYDSTFYLKTHKTGSTTIARLLYSYTHRQKLKTLKAPGHIFISKPNPSSHKVDAAVGHHFAFNWDIIHSYLHRPPSLILTSLRLPLQRRLSWFRQQNREFESLICPVLSPNASDLNIDTQEALLNFSGTTQVLNAFDKFVENNQMVGPQWKTMRESNARDSLGTNLTKILGQFQFVILKERMAESLECLCKTLNVRLCSESSPLVRMNVGDDDACVKRILLAFRLKELGTDCEMDSLLYESVSEDLSICIRSVPDYCKCPTVDG